MFFIGGAADGFYINMPVKANKFTFPFFPGMLRTNYPRFPMTEEELERMKEEREEERKRQLPEHTYIKRTIVNGDKSKRIVVMAKEGMNIVQIMMKLRMLDHPKNPLFYEEEDNANDFQPIYGRSAISAGVLQAG